MDNIKNLVSICNYGKINIKLKEIMDKNGISRNRLSHMTNTRFEVVDKWYNGSVERIDADVLARFCYCLNCKVEDILEYSESD